VQVAAWPAFTVVGAQITEAVLVAFEMDREVVCETGPLSL